MNRRNGASPVIHSLGWLCPILMMGAAPAVPSILPRLDLEYLARNADLIVVGRAVSQERVQQTTLGPDEGNIPAWITIVRLDVEKLIKGELETGGVSFRVVQPVEGVGAEAPRVKGVRLGQFGVFFLHRTDTGYEVLSPYYPFLPSAPGAPAGQGNYLDAVSAELVHVFRSRDPSVQSRFTRWEVVRALQSLRTPSATIALKAAAEDRDPIIRVWAISALLMRNDISMLGQVEKLGQIHPDPYLKNLTAQLYPALASVKDKRAIPQLTHLLHSKDVNIRRGAAAGLRNIQDAAVIQPLSESLYDHDREVQYQAVIGLAEITGAPSEWSPAYDTFLKDEKRYLDYWREWAKPRNERQPPESSSNK